MITTFKTLGRVPPAIQARAASMLPLSKPRKLKHCGGEVIDVGLRYRLYRAAKATCFFLMSHERYSKMTAKKRQRGRLN